ncbi:hypothetical protein ACQPX6_08295 [Actinomycetospora sp. CA-101289]|uniref:hypothetical protein n=1 Tax=Actinomycetospora sp. CA-101289 TaxID=3239893 RepID=UPI003D990A23
MVVDDAPSGARRPITGFYDTVPAANTGHPATWPASRWASATTTSALQALEPFLPRDAIRLGFVGLPFDRVRLLLEAGQAAVNVSSAGAYVLEQRGFTKIVDTTFVMGFFRSPSAGPQDVERYFRALLHAQQEIDLEPQCYTHY